MFLYLKKPYEYLSSYHFVLNLSPNEWAGEIPQHKTILASIIRDCSYTPNKTPLWHDLCLYHFGVFVNPDTTEENARLIFQNIVKEAAFVETQAAFVQLHQNIETCLAKNDFFNAFMLSLCIPFHYYGPIGHLIRSKVFQKAIETIQQDQINLEIAKHLLQQYYQDYGYPGEHLISASKAEVLEGFCTIFLAHVYTSQKYYDFTRFQTAINELRFNIIITESYGDINQMVAAGENFCSLVIRNVTAAQSNARHMIGEQHVTPNQNKIDFAPSCV
ncbi:MAG: hypothetical protein AB7F64_01230 [Gammaproteobacteria bacterium]